MTMALKSLKGELIDYPALAVCSSRAFKDPTMAMVTLDDYRNNTFNPDDFILHVEFDDPVAKERGYIDKRVFYSTSSIQK